MARGIKESRRFVFSGGSLSLPRNFPGRTAHHAGDALHPYIHDKAFDRGAPDRPSPPALNQYRPHAPPF